MTRKASARRGIVSIWVLVVLSVLTALIGTATWQYLAGRRVLRNRQQALQSSWLARSGIEVAAARLLADPRYRGETLTPLDDSRLEIEVEGLKDDQFRITATARYPASGQAHVRSATRTFQRTLEGGKARLLLPAP